MSDFGNPLLCLRDLGNPLLRLRDLGNLLLLEHLGNPLLLRDSFQKCYGKEWKKAYMYPDVRDSVLAELRVKLCREIRQVYLKDNAPERDPNRRSNCPCYLHRFFGADEDIKFPSCPQEDPAATEERSPCRKQVE